MTAAKLLENSSNGDKVILSDYNPEVLDNLRRNIRLNGLDASHEVLGLDWFDQLPSDDKNETEQVDDTTWVDMEGTARSQCRLVLGADLLVCSNDAELVAATIDNTLMEGGQAIILGPDSYTRFGVSAFPDACRSLGLTVKVEEDILESQDGSNEHQMMMMSELELGGYNQRASTYGHDFTLFTVSKPISSTA